MKKKLLIFFTILAFSLVGCKKETTINVNVENSSELNNTIFGIYSLIMIGDGLWYDSSTGIVYWWNGIMDESSRSTVPTAYYAPNGLPYRYNPETNTFVEVINKKYDE